MLIPCWLYARHPFRQRNRSASASIRCTVARSSASGSAIVSSNCSRSGHVIPACSAGRIHPELRGAPRAPRICDQRSLDPESPMPHDDQQQSSAAAASMALQGGPRHRCRRLARRFEVRRRLAGNESSPACTTASGIIGTAWRLNRAIRAMVFEQPVQKSDSTIWKVTLPQASSSILEACTAIAHNDAEVGMADVRSRPRAVNKRSWGRLCSHSIRIRRMHSGRNALRWPDGQYNGISVKASLARARPACVRCLWTPFPASCDSQLIDVIPACGCGEVYGALVWMYGGAVSHLGGS